MSVSYPTYSGSVGVAVGIRLCVAVRASVGGDGVAVRLSVFVSLRVGSGPEGVRVGPPVLVRGTGVSVSRRLCDGVTASVALADGTTDAVGLWGRESVAGPEVERESVKGTVAEGDSEAVGVSNGVRLGVAVRESLPSAEGEGEATGAIVVEGVGRYVAVGRRVRVGLALAVPLGAGDTLGVADAVGTEEPDGDPKGVPVPDTVSVRVPLGSTDRLVEGSGLCDEVAVSASGGERVCEIVRDGVGTCGSDTVAVAVGVASAALVCVGEGTRGREAVAVRVGGGEGEGVSVGVQEPVTDPAGEAVLVAEESERVWPDAVHVAGRTHERVAVGVGLPVPCGRAVAEPVRHGVAVAVREAVCEAGAAREAEAVGTAEGVRAREAVRVSVSEREAVGAEVGSGVRDGEAVRVPEAVPVAGGERSGEGETVRVGDVVARAVGVADDTVRVGATERVAVAVPVTVDVSVADPETVLVQATEGGAVVVADCVADGVRTSVAEAVCVRPGTALRVLVMDGVRVGTAVSVPARVRVAVSEWLSVPRGVRLRVGEEGAVTVSGTVSELEGERVESERDAGELEQVSEVGEGVAVGGIEAVRDGLGLVLRRGVRVGVAVEQVAEGAVGVSMFVGDSVGVTDRDREGGSGAVEVEVRVAEAVRLWDGELAVGVAGLGLLVAVAEAEVEAAAVGALDAVWERDAEAVGDAKGLGERDGVTDAVREAVGLANPVPEAVAWRVGEGAVVRDSETVRVPGGGSEEVRDAVRVGVAVCVGGGRAEWVADSVGVGVALGLGVGGVSVTEACGCAEREAVAVGPVVEAVPVRVVDWDLEADGTVPVAVRCGVGLRAAVPLPERVQESEAVWLAVREGEGTNVRGTDAEGVAEAEAERVADGVRDAEALRSGVGVGLRVRTGVGVEVALRVRVPGHDSDTVRGPEMEREADGVADATAEAVPLGAWDAVALTEDVGEPVRVGVHCVDAVRDSDADCGWLPDAVALEDREQLSRSVAVKERVVLQVPVEVSLRLCVREMEGRVGVAVGVKVAVGEPGPCSVGLRVSLGEAVGVPERDGAGVGGVRVQEVDSDATAASELEIVSEGVGAREGSQVRERERLWVAERAWLREREGLGMEGETLGAAVWDGLPVAVCVVPGVADGVAVVERLRRGVREAEAVAVAVLLRLRESVAVAVSVCEGAHDAVAVGVAEAVSRTGSDSETLGEGLGVGGVVGSQEGVVDDVAVRETSAEVVADGLELQDPVPVAEAALLPVADGRERLQVAPDDIVPDTVREALGVNTMLQLDHDGVVLELTDQLWSAEALRDRVHVGAWDREGEHVALGARDRVDWVGVGLRDAAEGVWVPVPDRTAVRETERRGVGESEGVGVAERVRSAEPVLEADGVAVRRRLVVAVGVRLGLRVPVTAGVAVEEWSVEGVHDSDSVLRPDAVPVADLVPDAVGLALGPQLRDAVWVVNGDPLRLTVRLPDRERERDGVADSDREHAAVAERVRVAEIVGVRVRERGEGVWLRGCVHEPEALADLVAEGCGVSVRVWVAVARSEAVALRAAVRLPVTCGDRDAVPSGLPVPEGVTERDTLREGVGEAEPPGDLETLAVRVSLGVALGERRVRLGLLNVREGVSRGVAEVGVRPEGVGEGLQVGLSGLRVGVGGPGVSAGDCVGDGVGVRERLGLRAGVGEGGDAERVPESPAVPVPVRRGVTLADGLRESEGEGMTEALGLRVGVGLRARLAEPVPDGVAVSGCDRERERVPLQVCVGSRVRVMVPELDCVGVSDPVPFAEHVDVALPLLVAVGVRSRLRDGVGVVPGDMVSVGVISGEYVRDRLRLRERVAEGPVGLLDGEHEGLRESETVAVGVRDGEPVADTRCRAVRVRETEGVRVPVAAGEPVHEREALRVAVWVGVAEGEREGERAEERDDVGVALGLWVRDREGCVRVDIGVGVGVRVGLREVEGLGLAVEPVKVLEGSDGVRDSLPEADPVAVERVREAWLRVAVPVRVPVEAVALGADRDVTGEAVCVSEALSVALPVALVLRNRDVVIVGVGLHDGRVAVTRSVRLAVTDTEAERECVAEADRKGLALRLADVDEVSDEERDGVAEGLWLWDVVGMADSSAEALGLRLGVREGVRGAVWLRLRLAEGDGVGECEGVGLPDAETRALREPVRVSKPLMEGVWVVVRLAEARSVGLGPLAVREGLVPVPEADREGLGVRVRVRVRLKVPEAVPEAVAVALPVAVLDGVPEADDVAARDGVSVGLRLRVAVRVRDREPVPDSARDCVALCVRDPVRTSVPVAEIVGEVAVCEGVAVLVGLGVSLADTVVAVTETDTDRERDGVSAPVLEAVPLIVPDRETWTLSLRVRVRLRLGVSVGRRVPEREGDRDGTRDRVTESVALRVPVRLADADGIAQREALGL